MTEQRKFLEPSAGVGDAQEKGLPTIGLTGKTAGKIRTRETWRAGFMRRPTRRRVFEEGHILIGHVFCEIVEQELLDEKGRVSGS